MYKAFLILISMLGNMSALWFLMCLFFNSFNLHAEERGTTHLNAEKTASAAHRHTRDREERDNTTMPMDEGEIVSGSS
ncbi:hypothetical protein CDAR_193861 [Caerostris darwini]|uniref:Secreted protein n=1 Tax=Caerostris darwini TaxID=1538125 RepID=A0AAV4VPE6_9ARAC|nr:hypothetical protein CDAR_193861 [Caerostris darwini]